MRSRLAPALVLALLVSPAVAKDKNKATLPAYVLSAQTLLVIVDPDAGEPVDQPYANKTARENVETAIMQWGRFRLVNDGEKSDLIITVRTGNGKAMRPTIKGGPIDQRPGEVEGTDDTIRIGAHQGQPPANPGSTPPGMSPPETGPHVSNEVGPSEDMLEVFRGDLEQSLNGPPAWRYVAKDCLSAPKVTAVEELRKAIADAEKPKPNKKP